MNEDTGELVKQLKSIKRWNMVGATGFLLVGIAATIFSATVFQLSSYMEDENIYENCGTDAETFSKDKASELIDQGNLDEALEYSGHRLETHPNDADAHWVKAKAHYLNEEWNLALEHLDKAERLSPGWKDGYTSPMREKIKELRDNAT